MKFHLGKRDEMKEIVDSRNRFPKIVIPMQLIANRSELEYGTAYKKNEKIILNFSLCKFTAIVFRLFCIQSSH